MDLLYCNYNSNSKYLKLLGFYLLIVLGNILTISQISNLIITIPQVIFVLWYLIKGNLQNAVLLHFSFIITGLTVTGLLGMFDTVDASMLYNYASIKLVGPISLSYFISIILFIFCRTKDIKLDKTTLYYQTFNVIKKLAIFGFVIGGLGFLVDDNYSIAGALVPSIYIFIVLLNMYILLCTYSGQMVRAVYHLSLILIISSIVSSLIAAYFFNVSSAYGGLTITYGADIVFYGPILFVAFLFSQRRILMIMSIVCFIFLSITFIGGKGLFGILFALVAMSYLLFFDRETKYRLAKRINLYRMFVVIGVIFALAKISISEDVLMFAKIHQVQSLFSGSLDSIDVSPYVRVVSLLNILNDGLHNPFTLLFGNGYGGYFTDKLNLLSVLPNLDEGGFSVEDVKSGCFHTGHDTMVTIPLYNGLLGLFLILRIVWLYVKKLKNNYLAFTSIMWLFLLFYFNTLQGIAGLFFLMGSEYTVRKTEK